MFLKTLIKISLFGVLIVIIWFLLFSQAANFPYISSDCVPEIDTNCKVPLLSLPGGVGADYLIITAALVLLGKLILLVTSKLQTSLIMDFFGSVITPFLILFGLAYINISKHVVEPGTGLIAMTRQWFDVAMVGVPATQVLRDTIAQSGLFTLYILIIWLITVGLYKLISKR